MTKAELVARAVALSLGEEAALKKLSNTDLESLLKENDPDFGKTAQGSDETGKATGKGDDPRTGKKIRCRIEASSDPDGKFPVYGSVNGYNFEAPRGKDIELDEGFVRHLRGLTITDFEAVLTGDGRPTGDYNEVHRARFNVVEL